jgi:aldose 1-epimerase
MTAEIVLADRAAGTSARIVPELGFNCYRFTVVHRGRPVEVLWSEAGFAEGHARASSSGIPILFPFPGRIPGTTLDYGGKAYPLTAGDGRGNAIHGFALDRPWRVLERSDTQAVGQFQMSVDDPARAGSWPADFRLTTTIRLSGGALSIDTLIENPDKAPLPYGLGLHPYFHVPLAGDDAAACLITIPANEVWELRNMLATGRRLPARARGDVQHGIAFGDTQFDDVFTALRKDQPASDTALRGAATATIAEPPGGVVVRVEMGEGFRECVVYNPPHREAICIEPYTCVPSAIVLQPRGIDAGLQIMPPGGSARLAMRIAVGPAE